ncbi:MAG: hypothetical protein KDB14_08800 [Planctomycetales bacterium]|nr:hypothetical protein [Planctomycetales bacterium]
MQFAVAMGTFCPVMSVLGAKRPQHQAWHFIVLSLWVVLILPAAEVLVLHPGQELEVHDSRAWFLLGLLLVNATHFVTTRFLPAGALLAAGQFLLLGRHLPWGLLREWSPATAFAALTLAQCCFAGAVVVAWAIPAASGTERDRRWRSFRDRYGMLWALRVAQRVNEVAAANQWPLSLEWDGFHDREGAPLAELPVEVERELDVCLRNLLRRFVSPVWLERWPAIASDVAEVVRNDAGETEAADTAPDDGNNPHD